MAAFDWFNQHEVIKQPVVQAKFAWPLKIQEKQGPQIIEKPAPIEYTAEIDTPLKQYICDTFGPMDCKIALGVAQAESGFREDAFNINTNDTIDVGIFQINSIHFAKEGCSLQDVVFANKNVECAYKIWKASGWNAWSAYKNESFLAHVE